MVAGLSAAWILDGLQITIASSATGVLASPDALGMTSTEVGLSVSVYLRPSPDVRVWRQQALMQRNTAEVL
jgi:D-serine dehydratase